MTLAILAFAIVASSSVWADSEEVTFEAEDGVTIDGTLFPADGAERVVIFAHGAVFDKASWYPQAEKLRAKGVAALPINFRGYGKSEAGPRSDLEKDVRGAIAFAKERGYSEIALVGGSMGGAAVLQALDGLADEAVDRAVLLAPAGGPPVKQTGIAKLFLVAEGDGLKPRVQSIHDASTDPKEIVVFSGSAHAQHVFKTGQGPSVEARILDFVSE
jgi:alpha-beta hydrolase superfamily lysophospholipase